MKEEVDPVILELSRASREYGANLRKATNAAIEVVRFGAPRILDTSPKK